jgi:hypothetical protein
MVKPIICHEWGHVLAMYLLYGTLKNIDKIEFKDTLYRMDGHTIYSYIYSEIDESGDIPYLYFLDRTDEKDIMVLLAGVIAEKICGYNKGRFRSDATDKAKIEQITLNKRIVSDLCKKTEEMLTPLKDTLNELTERSIEQYPQTRDENKEIYYCIFRDDIIRWVDELFPESLKPKNVCCIRKDNPRI